MRAVLGDDERRDEINLRLRCDDRLHWENVEKAWNAVSTFQNQDGKRVALIENILLFQCQEVQTAVIVEEFADEFTE